MLGVDIRRCTGTQPKSSYAAIGARDDASVRHAARRSGKPGEPALWLAACSAPLDPHERLPRLPVTGRVAHAWDRIAGTAVGLGLLARAVWTPPPRSVPLAERLAALPGRLPVAEAVRIHWSGQQIPFIEAHSDADLAVALGAVHAHLRLAQMEMMRRVALGRVAETIGPLGIELDRALHLFDFGRAVPQIIAGLDDDTRAWAMGFLSGVNHVLAHGAPPHEFRLLGNMTIAGAVELKKQCRCNGVVSLRVLIDGVHLRVVKQLNAGHRRAKLDGFNDRFHRAFNARE